MNITRIESRISKLRKLYFFVDFQGSVGDENVDNLLESLKDFGFRNLLILDEKQVAFSGSFQ